MAVVMTTAGGRALVVRGTGQHNYVKLDCTKRAFGTTPQAEKGQGQKRDGQQSPIPASDHGLDPAALEKDHLAIDLHRHIALAALPRYVLGGGAGLPAEIFGSIAASGRAAIMAKRQIAVGSKLEHVRRSNSNKMTSCQNWGNQILNSCILVAF
jgi:hypothetical protein